MTDGISSFHPVQSPQAQPGTVKNKNKKMESIDKVFVKQQLNKDDIPAGAIQEQHQVSLKDKNEQEQVILSTNKDNILEVKVSLPEKSIEEAHLSQVQQEGIQESKLPQDVVGKTYITNIQTGKKTEVHFYENKSPKQGYKEFSVHDPVAGIILGDIQFCVAKETPNGLVDPRYGKKPLDEKHPMFRYGERELRGKSFVWVESVSSYSNKDYKGVGTSLMQLAVEYGNQDGTCECRVKLNASYGSYAFYLKQGFTTGSSKTDAELLEHDAQKRALGQLEQDDDKGAFQMRTNQQGRAMWAERIKDNPILRKDYTF